MRECDVSTIFWSLPTTNLKNLNKHAIIDLIRFTPGGISRVELARRMNLTRAAITAIVDDLVAIHLVIETEGHYPSGRKPIVLEINPARGRVVGVDMGASHLNIILADFSARGTAEIEIRLDINRGPHVCLAQMDELVRKLLHQNNVSLADVAAIGVGVPGPIVAEAGMVSGPPIMPGWDGYPIRDHLQGAWGCPVTLNNDAELGAVGEWAYGAGRGERNLAYIKVGTGVGSGLLLDGQLYRGATGSAGEIGHITIDENGPVCTCGNRGCLEAFAGGGAIARKAVDSVRRKQRTQLSELVENPDFTAMDVMRAARHGDLVAQRIVSEAGTHLGTAIASMVNLFNPSMVVIGGSISQIGDLLLEPIRTAVLKRSLQPASRAVRISAALLGRRSCAMGAVVQAISVAIHRLVDERDPLPE
jgi:glucokinase-like ROK family protein